ncbi:MAG: hypothetical protein AB8U25_05400 [Rickettsiales endosymbiont of Dermacentor nuttalli]
MSLNRKKEFINISKIVTNCKSILFSKLHKNQIECTIEISTEREIEYDKSTNLILLNFLFKSIYKTPKKGKISISLAERENQTLIRSEDNAFDLKVNSKLLGVTYRLPDITLNDLAEEYNIKIIKSPGDQVNTIDIILINKTSNYSKTWKYYPFPD